MRTLSPFIPKYLVLVMTLGLLSACTLGPDYKRPDIPEPTEYRESKGWKLARPADVLHKDTWWELYEDPILNQLVRRLNDSNQTVAVAEAQYRQAHALVQAAWAQRMPSVTSSSTFTRSVSSSGGTSGGSSSRGGSTSGGGYDCDGDGDYDEDDEYCQQETGNTGTGTTGTGSNSSSGSSSSGSSSSSSSTKSPVRERYDVGLSVSWSADLWGNLRRNQESQQALKEANAANLAAIRLAQQASLVQAYLQLRVLDAQQRLLDRTVEAYSRSLRLTKNQYEAGMVAKLDTTQAESQLKTTEAQAIDLKWQRAQYEHAIAVLVGVAPSELSIDAVETTPIVPDIPVGVPSRLLERRPDVAAAERNVISANASIGVAETAWFPDLTISANGGFSRTDSTADLFSVPYRYWSIGPRLDQTLLDFGARRSQLRQAEATYDQQVANYRQTVLTSLQEVEDYLIQLQVLEREMELQELATVAAKESLRLMENQYKAGMIDYLSVVNLQTSALTSERSVLSQLNNRLVASVQLIAALGGGWNGEPYPDLSPEELIAQAQEAEKQRQAEENASLMDKMKNNVEKSLTWLKEYL